MMGKNMESRNLYQHQGREKEKSHYFFPMLHMFANLTNDRDYKS